MRATLRFKLAIVTLSGRPCLIKSWSGRCGKGVGKNVKSIAPPHPNPLNPSPRRGDELVVWSLQTEDQTEKDSTFYHIVCSNVGKEANIHPRNLANFKVRSFTKWFDIINWVDIVNWPSLWVWKLTFRALSFFYSHTVTIVRMSSNSFCNLLCETNPWLMQGNTVIEETTGQNSSFIKSFKISLTLAHWWWPEGCPGNYLVL